MRSTPDGPPFPGRRRTSLLVTLGGLIVAGLAGLGLIVYSTSLTAAHHTASTPLRRMTDHVGKNVVEAHLWLEEALIGDATIVPERDVFDRFQAAIDVIDAALAGDDSVIGRFRPVSSPTLRRELRVIRGMVGELRGIARTRWANKQVSGGEADRRFDARFRDLTDRCDALIADVDTEVARDRRLLWWINGALGTAFALVFFGVTVVVVRRRRLDQERLAELERRVEERTLLLSEKESRLRTILNAAGDGVVTVDATGRIEWFNRAAEQMFGLDASAARGAQVVTLLAGSPTEQEQAWRRIREADGVSETNARRADGEAFPVEVTSKAAEAAGRTLYTWVVRDVSARKRLDEERRRARTKLERVNRDLAAARDAADAANRAKTAFVANMSHEMRTPLNAVLGFTELLQGGELPPNEAELARKAHGSGQALLAVINDVLDFSKIEAGGIELTVAPFELPALLDSIRDLLADQAARESIALGITIADDVPTRVAGDADRVRQIVLNLLSNALKFTERGSVTLTVDRAPGGGDDVRFVVEDTGIGLPDDVDRLFAPFAQADGSTTRRFGGTGLGLAICQQLATLMHGHIDAHARESGGSRFTFTVPLPVASGAPAPAPTRSPTIDGAGRAILVVEDHALNREVVARMLARFGFAVDTAENGRIALDRFDPERHVLVLMDSQMPVMDGCTAARAIRASESPNRRVPIVALTANATAEERARTRRAGMDDFLSKPIAADRLSTILARWATPGAAGDTTPEPTADDPAFEGEALARLNALGGDDDPAFATRMIELFMRDAPPMAEEIGAAIDAEDRDTVRAVAHRLKGAAQQIGARRVARACVTLETTLDGAERPADLARAVTAEVRLAHASFERLLALGA